MTHLITTLGLKEAQELGFILPHEHIFLDLRTGEPPDFAQADPADVIALMEPEIKRAQAAGVTALVECTPVGVGRRADILKAVSEATGFPLVVPTGIYRQDWIPGWARAASEDDLRDWMLGELLGEIEGSGVQAAWIKLSASDDGLTDNEITILRAAAQAGAATGAIMGSHTIRGRVVRDQLAVIEQAGYTPERFIWIHAQAEPDFALHLEMARHGVWIEYDWIGGTGPITDEQYIDSIQRLLDAGHDKILISQDRGWYDAGQLGGGTPQPFTYLSDQFLPRLRAAGFDETAVRLLTHENPFRAFAR